MLNTHGLLKAVEDIYEKQEEAFEWAKIMFKLEETCPTHRVGMKSLELQRYSCPVCNKFLSKIPNN